MTYFHFQSNSVFMVSTKEKNSTIQQLQQLTRKKKNLQTGWRTTDSMHLKDYKKVSLLGSKI